MNADQEPKQQAGAGRRRRVRWVLAAAALAAVVLSAALLFLQSRSFHEMVRRRLVAALEQTTGARVELQGFDLQWTRLQVTLRGLVIYGSEGAQEPPLFSAAWVEARWHLLSFWTLRANLEQVRILEPKLHIVVDSRGNSNLPQPVHALSGASRSGGQWITLQIGSLEVLRGEVQWNDKSIPLAFHARQVHVRVDYQPKAKRYAGLLEYRDGVLAGSESGSVPSSGQLQFSVYTDHADIESVKWDSPKSHVTGGGTIQDFNAPQFQFHYDVQADWGEVAGLLGMSGWDGDLHWAGTGNLSRSSWRLEGQAQARMRRNAIRQWSQVPWSAQGLLRIESAPDRPALPRAHPGSAPQAADQSGAWQASIQDLEVKALGGQLHGSVAVGPSAAGPSTTLTLAADRLGFPQLFGALGNALSVPLEQLHWAGALSGELEARFIGAGQNLTLSVDCRVDPLAVAPPGFLPVSGELHGSYDAAHNRVESLNSYLNLPQTHMEGAGWFGEKDSAMRFALETGDLEDARSLGELAWKGSTALPLHLFGRASATMQWTGGTSRPRFLGTLRAANFSYQRTHWDSFAGQLDYQEGLLSSATRNRGRQNLAGMQAGQAQLAIRGGQLRKGRAALDFDLRLGLENGTFEPQSAFSLSARIQGAEITELQDMAGLHYPVSGTLEASLTASGTRQSPGGRGTFTLTRGAIHNESFDQLTADLTLSPGGVIVANSIRARKAGASLQGNLRFDQGSRQVELEMSGTDFPIGSLQVLRNEKFPLAGLAQWSLTLQGPLSGPQIQGQAAIRDFQWGPQRGGRVAIDVETKEEHAQWSITATLPSGSLRGSGQTGLDAPHSSTAQIEFTHFDLPLLVSLFGTRPEGLEGSVTGTAAAALSGTDWSGLALHGEISGFDGSYGGDAFHNAAPISFHYQNSTLGLEGVHLTGGDLDVNASGTLRLGPDPAISVDLRGHADLGILKRIDPQVITSGQVQVEAQLGGTFGHPLWHGSVAMADASFHYGTLPNGFDKVNGAIVFDGNTGVLDNVHAETGGGQLQIGGYVQRGGPSGWQFNLSATAASVRVRYPAGLTTWVDGQLEWNGTVAGSRLEGRLTIARQSTSPSFDLAQAFLARRYEASSSTMPALFRNTRLSIDLVSGPGIHLDTLTAHNIQTDIQLQVQGTVAQPVWLGRIGIVEGEIEFAGKTYTVNRGEISFLNPFRSEPVLDLSVQSRVQKYDISMDFNGPPDRLTVTYSSDPPLPTSDILGLLVAGNAVDTSLEASNGQPVPQLGANTLLTQALRTQVTSRLDRLFGVGRFRVDPLVSELGHSTDASLALEQQFTNNLTITYVRDVTTSQQQLIQGEWTISPKLSVVGIRDQNGLFGLNFQLTLRFR